MEQALKKPAHGGYPDATISPTQSMKRFSGGFMIFKLKCGRNLSKRMSGNPLPWVRHETLEAAETEAARLNAQFPDSTFLIMQEVARVKTATVQ